MPGEAVGIGFVFCTGGVGILCCGLVGQYQIRPLFDSIKTKRIGPCVIMGVALLYKLSWEQIIQARISW